MITMLSQFDLKPGGDFETVRVAYDRFAAEMTEKGIIEGTGRVCQRVADTRMDTDGKNARKYYALMYFRDKDQLEESYDYIQGLMVGDKCDHVALIRFITNAVFTCFEEVV